MSRKQLPNALRFEILQRDGFRCRYCGRKSNKAELHVDHIHPLKAHGTDAKENLAASCRRCNLGKHAKVIADPDIFQIQISPARAPNLYPRIPKKIILTNEMREFLAHVLDQYSIDPYLFCVLSIRDTIDRFRAAPPKYISTRPPAPMPQSPILIEGRIPNHRFRWGDLGDSTNSQA